MQLSTESFDRKNGEAGFLLSLLNELLRLAAAHGLAEALQACQQFNGLDVVTRIKMFVDLLPHNVPHFILVDEVQNFFLLEKQDGTLDGQSINQMRRRVRVKCRFAR